MASKKKKKTRRASPARRPAAPAESAPAEAAASPDARRVLPTGELTEHACPTCHDTGTVDRAESGLAQPQPCPECKKS